MQEEAGELDRGSFSYCNMKIFTCRPLSSLAQTTAAHVHLGLRLKQQSQGTSPGLCPGCM